MNPKLESLIKSLFAIDEKGNVFVRVAEQKPSGELKNAVSTKSNRDISSLLSGCVVLDPDGKPALRLVAVKASMSFEDARKQKNAKGIALVAKLKKDSLARHNKKEDKDS